MHLQSGRFRHRANERARGALPIRAGEMDSLRNAVLRIAQFDQRLADMRGPECRRHPPARRLSEPVQFGFYDSGVSQSGRFSSARTTRPQSAI
jgi:hypothetical protein